MRLWKSGRPIIPGANFFSEIGLRIISVHKSLKRCYAQPESCIPARAGMQLILLHHHIAGRV